MLRFDLKTRLDLLKTDIPDSPADRVAEKRRIRKHQVLDIIRTHGPIPRVEIARLLGFNLPSVSSLVDDLLVDGLATEDKAIKTAIGRRPIPVVFNPSAASIIGVDVGKTCTIGLLMNLGGTILGRLEKTTPAPLDFAALPATLESFIQELIASCAPPIPPLAGVGIGLPGILYDPRGGKDRLMTPQAQRLKDRIAALLGATVIVDNDARMMAYGALRFGNAAGRPCMAIVNLGFGLGLGLVIGGTVYQGFCGIASELGHIPLGEPAVSCHCGLDRCLENVASGSGLERLGRGLGIRIGDRPATSAELAELARSGDPRARQVFSRFAGALAHGLATLITLFNPEVVVLAGRVARASDVFMEPLFEELQKLTFPGVDVRSQVIVSDLFENAGPLGACACVLHHIFSSAHITVESIV